jgi:2-haloacid dehalogenase
MLDHCLPPSRSTIRKPPIIDAMESTADRWATFDCYGTLVDWLDGIHDTLADLWPDADPQRLLDRYHEVEPIVQAGSGAAYRDIMAETLTRVAASEDLAIPAGRTDALADSLPHWPVFAEVPSVLRELRVRGWRLAALSNTDRALWKASEEAIGVGFDLAVVASEIGSYKPDPSHWEEFFRQTDADRARHVHVAASLFHDVEPCHRLGLRCVWINRLGETSDLPRAGELPDLGGLADRLDQLVPAG